ncbi:hypothetical protein EAG_02438 [Camponotus floridanus]|uniref:EamA domain-containing protein n=1 Tax=Camponotus floridanus TaxID=104421 RepID=E2AI25_CAMFO|nr:hypothetical protein EAG_02438 [Camponotus floridanus]
MTLPLLYYSFQTLPLEDAMAIISSSPVIVIALSFLFLNEPCSILRILMTCTFFTGVILSRPFFEDVKKHIENSIKDVENVTCWYKRISPLFEVWLIIHKSYNFMGYLCAILATVFMAFNIVVMRKCSEIHYSILLLNLSFWSYASSIFFYFTVHNHNIYEVVFINSWFIWSKIILVALIDLYSQILMMKALKIEGASKVSITRSQVIILVYMIDMYTHGYTNFFYNSKVPTLTILIGTILIIFSVIGMSFEKRSTPSAISVACEQNDRDRINREEESLRANNLISKSVLVRRE